MRMFLLIMIAFFIVSCDKSDKGEEFEKLNKNEMTFNGVTYPLITAELETFTHGGNNDEQTIYIAFFDKTIDKEVLFDWANNYLTDIDIAENSTTIGFNIYNDSISYDMTTKRCVYLDANNNVNLGVELNTDSMKFTEEYSFSSGKFCIEKTGGDFEIEFECQTENGNEITGYYFGNVYELVTSD